MGPGSHIFLAKKELKNQSILKNMGSVECQKIDRSKLGLTSRTEDDLRALRYDLSFGDSQPCECSLKTVGVGPRNEDIAAAFASVEKKHGDIMRYPTSQPCSPRVPTCPEQSHPPIGRHPQGEKQHVLLGMTPIRHQYNTTCHRPRGLGMNGPWAVLLL